MRPIIWNICDISSNPDFFLPETMHNLNINLLRLISRTSFNTVILDLFPKLTCKSKNNIGAKQQFFFFLYCSLFVHFKEPPSSTRLILRGHHIFSLGCGLNKQSEAQVSHMVHILQYANDAAITNVILCNIWRF